MAYSPKRMTRFAGSAIGIRGSKPWLALAAMMAAILLLTTPPVTAAARDAALIVDANTGAVLHADNADAERYPASLTKMMTLYMVFDLMERGKLRETTQIPVSAAAASEPPSKLGLRAGSTIALGDAIRALITKSANDVAYAIAEHIGGSERQFAQMMTERARQLGMSRTTFRNASGLPDGDQVTTARDMVTLALRLQDAFPKSYRLFSTRRFTYDGDTYRNHNNLLFNFEGTEGIKTGYTRASGFNLVASVRRDGRHLVGAVFGGRSASVRDARMRTLLLRALPKASTVKTRRPALIASRVPRPEAVRRAAVAPPARMDELPERPATPRTAVLPVPKPVEIAIRPAASSPIESESVTTANTTTIAMARVRTIDIGSAVAARASREAASAPERGVVPISLNAPEPFGGASAPQARASGPSTPPAFAENGRPRSRAEALALPVDSGTTPRPIWEPTAGPTAGPGLRPSTLQAQAAALAQADGGPPPAWQGAGMRRFAAPSALGVRERVAVVAPLETPAPAPFVAAPPAASLPAAAGPYQIQVGAYTSAQEAQRQLAAVRAQATALLAPYNPMAIAVDAAGKRLYRARYAGFDSASATSICTELRRRQIDCFVTKAQ